MPDSTFQKATLGGGCFWCLEAVFELVKGVRSVASGYAGGKTPTPKYRDVCSGETGHAEVIQITFDPATISFGDLLSLFFSFHDPTTPNRQGADVGTQYRSVIFAHTPEQRAEAEQMIAELNREGIYPNPIVTEVADLPEFFPAEDYHQGYFRNNPAQGYCQAVVAPKVAKLRKYFSERMKSDR